VNITIGDPDSTITGEHWYYIEYMMDGVVNGFDGQDEFYWNVTGNEWEVPIQSATAKVVLPKGNDQAHSGAVCYTGQGGSTAQNCFSEISSKSEYVYGTSGSLNALEGLTIAAVFKEGIVDLPSKLNVSGEPEGSKVYVDDEYYGVSPLLIRMSAGEKEVRIDHSYQYFEEVKVLKLKPEEVRDYEFELKESIWGPIMERYFPIGMFVMLIGGVFGFWKKWGKDPEGRGVIMPIYKPPEGLTPGDMGVLVDEKADMHDITGTMVSLAVKGYLKIIAEEKKGLLWGTNTTYKFEKLKEVDESLVDYEKKIFEAIFSGTSKVVELSTLKNKFYKDLGAIKKAMYKRVTEDSKFFDKDPDKVRTKYFIIVGVVSFLLWGAGIVTLIISFGAWYLLWVVLIPLSFYMASLMPRKTKEGVEIYEKVLGYKMFLETTETDRLRVLFSPKEYREVFEKNLPFAMVLGVEKLWAGQFADLYKGVPTWYMGPGTFGDFTNSMSDLNTSAGTAFASSPGGAAGGGSGFGGGGFSGGGFGGGGGGSW